jgi:hypothetical protein
MTPDSSRAVSSESNGWQRYMNASIKKTFSARATSITRSAEAASRVSGFSQSTAFRARKQAIACRSWNGCGEAT